MLHLIDFFLPFDTPLSVRKQLMDRIDEGISALDFYGDESVEETKELNSQPLNLAVQCHLAGFLAKILIGFLPDRIRDRSNLIKDVMWITWMSKLRNSL
ncbi:unnamed protein product, partial [Mesorhabditis belari]|uniref:Uncharacterized protein n=1 Tax=Mesorhabditis belari TaxID=2138241 RepID=A0AAF3EZX4_9BILA